MLIGWRLRGGGRGSHCLELGGKAVVDYLDFRGLILSQVDVVWKVGVPQKVAFLSCTVLCAWSFLRIIYIREH